jgi:polyphosphate kinase
VAYREIGVAPVNLRRRLQLLLRREAEHARAGRPAHVVIKVNALTDPRMIRELYRTARAGVAIDLIVRGMCTLRPGVPGVSENIQVRSIVGRFLEHTRIYSFENGGAKETYLASADLMERNLNRRVEVMFPLKDSALASWVRDTVLDTYLRDTARAMVLRIDGEYERVEPAGDAPAVDSQLRLAQRLPPRAAAAEPLSQGAAAAATREPDWRLRLDTPQADEG